MTLITDIDAAFNDVLSECAHTQGREALLCYLEAMRQIMPKGSLPADVLQMQAGKIIAGIAEERREAREDRENEAEERSLGREYDAGRA